MPPLDRIVIVTKKTALEELIERHNSKAQAQFYLEHMGVSFSEYEITHNNYHAALTALREAIPTEVQVSSFERSFLPNFLFGEHDLVITLGPDGLVVNTAKYLTNQFLLAFNPDLARIDGILVPFAVQEAATVLKQVLSGYCNVFKISMAKATLNDGQVMYALNDIFIGQRSHVSARYSLRLKDKQENQSSSGIIISTGAGSTGWLRSIITGAAKVMETFSKSQALQSAQDKYRFAWEADYLYFSVREPFVSKTSSSTLVFGKIPSGEILEIVSHMPQNGVIFSDGIESDYLQFNSSAIAHISLAEKKLNLIAKSR